MKIFGKNQNSQNSIHTRIKDNFQTNPKMNLRISQKFTKGKTKKKEMEDEEVENNIPVM